MDGSFRASTEECRIRHGRLTVPHGQEHLSSPWCIADLAELELTINIEKEQDEDVLTLLKEEFDKKKIRVESLDFLRLSISNTLSEDIDLQELQGKIAEIFDKTKDTETVKKYSQREGGTGLYKLYKTFQYNINTAYSILYSIEKQTFTITILFGTMNIVA